MYEYNQDTAVVFRNIEGIDVEPPEVLTHQFILQKKLPLYVLNASAAPMSNVVITIRQPGQPGTGVKIERSKAPKEITGEVSHEQLRIGGKELWNLLNNGVLQLVWPADAVKMLGGRTGEQQRKKLSKFSALNAEPTAEMISRAEQTKQYDQAKDEAEAEVQELENPVNARVLELVARNIAGEIKAEGASKEFDLLDGLLTERDLSYAITNVKSGKLRDYLQGKLATLETAEKQKPEATKKAEAAKAATKKRTADLSGGVFDSSEEEMTEEEKEIERKEEARARSRQKLS